MARSPGMSWTTSAERPMTGEPDDELDERSGRPRWPLTWRGLLPASDGCGSSSCGGRLRAAGALPARRCARAGGRTGSRSRRWRRSRRGSSATTRRVGRPAGQAGAAVRARADRRRCCATAWTRSTPTAIAPAFVRYLIDSAASRREPCLNRRCASSASMARASPRGADHHRGAQRRSPPAAGRAARARAGVLASAPRRLAGDAAMPGAGGDARRRHLHRRRRAVLDRPGDRPEHAQPRRRRARAPPRAVRRARSALGAGARALRRSPRRRGRAGCRRCARAATAELRARVRRSARRRDRHAGARARPGDDVGDGARLV